MSRDLNVGSTAADFWLEWLERIFGNLIIGSGAENTPQRLPFLLKKGLNQHQQKSWKSEGSSDFSKKWFVLSWLTPNPQLLFQSAISWHLQWLSLYFLVSKPLSSPSSHGLSLTYWCSNQIDGKPRENPPNIHSNQAFTSDAPVPLAPFMARKSCENLWEHLSNPTKRRWTPMKSYEKLWTPIENIVL